MLIVALANGHEWPFNNSPSTTTCVTGQLDTTSFLLHIVYPNGSATGFFGPPNQTVPRDQVYGVGGGGAWMYHVIIKNNDSLADHEINGFSVSAPWIGVSTNPNVPIVIKTMTNVTITVGWPNDWYNRLIRGNVVHAVGFCT